MSAICLKHYSVDSKLYSRLIVASLIKELRNKNFPMETLDYSDILCDYDHLTKLFDKKENFFCFFSANKNTGITSLSERYNQDGEISFIITYNIKETLITINFKVD